jgi:ribosomal protein L2
VSSVDLLALAFHFSGVAVLALLGLTLRDALRASPDEPHGGGGATDRISPPRPPWSWHPRGGRSAARRARSARRVRSRSRR